MNQKPATPDRRVFILEIQSEPGIAVPEEVRLRRLLKTLLRTYGLRCTRVEERKEPDKE